MINRLIKPSENNSLLLFGARGTGKSTWLKSEFLQNKTHLYINLLDPDEEARLSRSPGELLQQIDALVDKPAWVVIDEVQKIPKLLDVVHMILESERKILFALTGSSARKLRRGQANLLAGRAFVYHLHPFTHIELGEGFLLDEVLSWGSLPKIFSLENAADKQLFLKTYTQTYLKEEIVAEQVVRKLDPFRQFLNVCAQHNGEVINYSSLARDVGVETVTAQSYFQILEDTLIGYLLPAYHRSLRKRQGQNPKFYFFDLGIKRQLDGTILQPPVEGTYGYGKNFEHFVIVEIIRLNDYYGKDFRLSYLRTKDGAEIDLIVERPGAPVALIEIKSKKTMSELDLRTLKVFKKDFGNQTEAYCLSQDPVAKLIDGVHVLPWQEGIKALFS